MEGGRQVQMARREHCTVASWAKPNRTVGSESERELGVGRLFDNKISEQIILIIVFFARAAQLGASAKKILFCKLIEFGC